MAAGDMAVMCLGTFKMSGAGTYLSGSLMANIPYSSHLSGSEIRLVPLANGYEVGVFKIEVL